MKKPLLLLTLLTFITLGCKSDKKNKLLGNWTVEQASRGGSPTQTLKGLFFDFKEGDDVDSNLMGNDEDLHYDQTKEQIKIWDYQDTLTFDYHYEEDNLILSTTMGGEIIEISLHQEGE